TRRTPYRSEWSRPGRLPKLTALNRLRTTRGERDAADFRFRRAGLSAHENGREFFNAFSGATQKSF
ncbi:hypothetical protein, partial [Streptomyces sp. bgisy031]|uniref:hypothetical protein n=1 Tax=Streptomyces sp. bgisy031 TaxID=3413772 RepID=UPI003D713A08